MKLLVWIVAALLTLFWTGVVAVSAALLSWGGDLIASGGAADWGRAAAQWPVPAWISPWVDPALVQALQEALTWALNAFGGALPAAGALVGWLVPLAWVIWVVGLALLIALAVLAHWLAGRQGPAWRAHVRPLA